MHSLVTGGTGFVGLRLLTKLRDAVVLSRDARAAKAIIAGDVRCFDWQPGYEPAPAAAFADVDTIFHLAGETIQGRLTAKKKRQIYDTRIVGTRNLIAGLRDLSRRPRVLVCASAVGFYGDRGDEVLDETSAAGSDFLAGVCRDWEAEAQKAEALGLRVVSVRSGIVLELGGGALGAMLPPFRLGLGGPLGSGEQYMSWIHLDDLVALLLFAATTESVRGVMNATAPNPVRNRDFTRSLGRALDRPAFLPVPKLGLRALFGEGAEILVGSQRVLPRLAEAKGYRFVYPELDPAFAHIFAERGE